MARSKYEKKAHKILEEEGYFVDYKIRPRFPIKNYNVDYFNAFDLLAYKDGFPLRWISIKGTGGNRQANKKHIASLNFPEGNIKELWWIDHKGQLRQDIIP